MNDKLNILKNLGKISIKAIKKIKENLKAGIYINDLKKISEKIIKKKYELGFPILISVNNYVAHFHPTKEKNYKLKKGDIVKIDLGAYDKKSNLMVDCARTYEVETNFKKKLISTTKKCFDSAIKIINKKLKENKEIKTYLITEEMNKNLKDFYMVRGLCGHRIFYDIIHAAPRIYNNLENINKKEVIEKEQVYAIEPILFESKDILTLEKEFFPSLFQIKKVNILKFTNNELLYLIFKKYQFRWFAIEEISKEFNINLLFLKKKFKSFVDLEYLSCDYPLKSEKNTISTHYENSIYIKKNFCYVLTK